MSVRKRILFSGQVQGVGFRYTAQRLAQGFRVAGSVRNLPDGSVELIVEGEPGEVDAYQNALAGRMAECIERTAVHEEPPAGLQGFQVRY